MCCQRFARLCGSSPVDGSSRKSSGGACMSPSATSSRRFCPPLSCCTVRVAKLARSSDSISSSARFADAALRHSVEGALAEQLVAHPLREAAAGELPDVADAGADVGGPLQDVVADDARRARGRRDEGGEHAEARRLARAVRPEEGDEFAAVDLEGQVGDGFDGLLLDGESLGQTLRFDDRFIRHGSKVETIADRFRPRSRAILRHVRYDHPRPVAAEPAADAPALAGHRTGRAPRRHRAHGPPRRRAPARARLPHRVDARGRRRVPPRGGQRGAAAAAHRRGGGGDGDRAAGRRRPAARRRPGDGARRRSRSSSRCCPLPCAGGSTRSPTPCSRPASAAAKPCPPRFSANSRSPAATTSACGSPTPRPSGEVSRRRVEPYALAPADRHWYLLCWDLEREDWRTFRVDRVSGDRAHARALRAPPAHARADRGVHPRRPLVGAHGRRDRRRHGPPHRRDARGIRPVGPGRDTGGRRTAPAGPSAARTSARRCTGWPGSRPASSTRPTSPNRRAPSCGRRSSGCCVHWIPSRRSRSRDPRCHRKTHSETTVHESGPVSCSGATVGSSRRSGRSRAPVHTWKRCGFDSRRRVHFRKPRSQCERSRRCCPNEQSRRRGPGGAPNLLGPDDSGRPRHCHGVRFVGTHGSHRGQPLNVARHRPGHRPRWAHRLRAGRRGFGDETIFTANADGTGERQLTEYGESCCPRVSSDGSRVMYSASAPDGQRITIAIQDLESGTVTLIPLPDETANLGAVLGRRTTSASRFSYGTRPSRHGTVCTRSRRMTAVT